MNKEQKQILSASAVVIIVLAAVTFSHRGGFTFVDKPVPSVREDYNAYLASLKIDPAASKDLYEQVITAEQVQKQMEQELQVDQQITPTPVPTASLNVAKQNTTQTLAAYFKSHVLLTDPLKQAAPAGASLFSAGASLQQAQKLADTAASTLAQYYKVQVPSEAVQFQKDQITSIQAYADLIKLGKAYALDKTVDPWPDVYKDYSIINSATADANAEYDKLDKKYAITEAMNGNETASSMLVPSAQALIPVVDVKAIAMAIYQEALASAFAQFSSQFLEKLIAQIENNYRIANFLYYTDALVSGQYVDDYLNKYVQGSLDKAMIKNFIPQFSCGSSQNLKTVFKAKADQYLGFDPSTVSPNDPDYYTKMSKVGNFLSSPTGWELYYQDVAQQAQAAAEQSAQNELTSSGIKASRDDSGLIAGAVSSVNASMQAAIQSYFNLGNDNSRSLVGKIVGGLIQQFMNKFVFKGAVLKEQKVCLSAPVIQPVIPGADVTQQPAPVQPSEFDIDQQYERGP